ncbi:MAG: malectin domain-containing carbohydrate-binding protein [Actinomycetota bacterium]|nr:malectin domain-containing carbohydrate-binding protein [Actinomycetota bacterium]
MKKLGVTMLVIGLLSLAPILMLGGGGKGVSSVDGPSTYSYEGGIIIELQGNSSSNLLKPNSVRGLDEATMQGYKFTQVREGRKFNYLVAGLVDSAYDLELSFVESGHDRSGQRVFDVSANGAPLPGLSELDVFTRVGLNHAYQITIPGVSAPDGTLLLSFKASSGLAMVSNVRLVSGGETALEIDSGESRHWTWAPLRFKGGEQQQVYEVALGRLGSRFMVNPMPQLLGWRQAPLGTWTDDFSELVLAFRDPEGDIRCLPFTGRYPVFSSIRQELYMTGVSYICDDPELPLQVRLNIEAPFYPGDVKLSTAPFFYLEIEITNPTQECIECEFLLARPHKDDDFGDQAPRALDGRHSGYKFTTRYTYGTENHVIDSSNSGSWDFWEALAVDDGEDVEWHYGNIAATSWIWESPEGYPLDFPRPLFTFVPRGYSGFKAPFAIEPGGLESLTAVLACHRSGEVLEVLGDQDYHFIYGDPSGAGLGSVDEVVDYALGGDMAAIEDKIEYFNTILSEPYLTGLSQAGKDLVSCAFQSFICNTWWCINGSGEEWFSVWEGEPYMYHSSLDVEYNNAWFYLYFWPELLQKSLREWTMFEKDNEQGKHLSHDMGIEHCIWGMNYPHDMAVEINTDYILLLYAYWKSTADSGLLEELFPRIEDYTTFVFNCDVDADGFPDLHVANTIDQGNTAIQESRNQIYLGVKALAAYHAAAEMARAQDPRDEAFISSCEEHVQLINRTLEGHWRGDHFAVCGDGALPEAEREAYSIYTANGLLYLLASGSETGLTPENLERMRIDLNSAAPATQRLYGCVHTSVNDDRQWVSQNLWRDALGFWLGVGGWPDVQEWRLQRYWDLERYFATFKSGAFWDSCAYNQGREERNGVVRGAFPPDFSCDQSLGYYSRGAASLALVSSRGRLGLDAVNGFLLYQPAFNSSHIPVMRCADWNAGAPAARIPVLIFGEGGELLEVINPHLLPENLQSR